jgi:hypothetical protein
MKGQWIGRFVGSSTGTIILNVDECNKWFQGTAYLLQDDKNIVNSSVGFSTLTKKNEFKFVTKNLIAINKFPGLPIPHEILTKEFPHSTMANQVEVNGKWTDKSISLSWKTNLNTVGSCTLKQSKIKTKSKLSSKKTSWDNFKKLISKMESKRHLFRGQKETWRLRTSFHRTGRSDVLRFINEDIPSLHKHLSARTKHAFNLEIPNENGAFFNLVQHHGYPTPLLDWTYSPYVAAFFAYRNVTKEMLNNANKNDKVRIILFDQAEWANDHTQFVHLATGRLHLSVSDFLAIENERMIPQQAASTITNIDDIETYIQDREKINNKKYLQAFDLPLDERNKVMQELRYMGITAGALFPGLDGACEELKNRNFYL